MLSISKRSSWARSALAVCALAASVATAQTAAPKPAPKSAGKTLGGKPAGGAKLMTRDELKACLARLDQVNQAAKALEAQRPLLDRERDELKAAGEALKAERAEVDRQLASVREWEARMRAHASEIETFNQRSAAVQEAPRGQQDKLVEDLKVERERLQQVRAALAADESKTVVAYQSGAKAYNERAIAHDAKVTDWNTRNAAAVDASGKQQESRTLWLNECANRPYLEDDEKAIQAGK